MRVAWVTEYPIAAFRSRPALINASDSISIPWVTLQAPLVAARRIELHVVTISKHAARDDEFVHDGVRFHVLRIPKLPRALLAYQLDRRRITQCLRRIGPDVVHGFGTEASFGYSAASSGYPAVVMIQGIVARIAQAAGAAEMLRRPGLWMSRIVERVTVRRCRHFVCETAFAAAFVREHNPRALIHSIRTPIADDWFTVTRNADAGAPPEVLFVGRATAVKGIEVLLEAFARVLAAFPGAVLHVVGACDPGYRRAILDPAMTRHGIAAQVRFHGHQPAAFVRQRLAAAALLALPTMMDTAPNVLAEARAAGVPVIASAVGGIPELIDEAVDGLLVPAGSADALAAATLRLLGDTALAGRLAERGRRRAFEEHRADVQVAKLIDVYRVIAAAEAARA